MIVLLSYYNNKRAEMSLSELLGGII